MRTNPFFLVVAAGLAAAPVFAEPAWTVAADEEGRWCLVSAAAADETALAVPAVVGGETVRSIGPRAFSWCPSLRELSVPAGVEWIDPDAFRGCPTLERIVVQSGNAVYSSAAGVLFDAAGLILLNCPEGWRGEYAVPAGTEEIDSGAFAGCTALTSVSFPVSVRRTGTGVFAGCTALKTLRIPADAPYGVKALGLPAGCKVVRYEPGGLDDPALPPRWAVRFLANGGTGTMDDQVFRRGKAAKLRKNAYSRTGYTFAGWAKKKGGPVVFKNGQSVKDLAAQGKVVKLYAVWTGVAYAVVLHPGAAGGKAVKQKMRVGTKTALPAKPFSRKGCVLAGWSKEKGGSIAYKDGQTVRDLSLTAGAKVHLHAVWAIRNYNVRFDANGGTGSMPGQSFVYGKAKRLRANSFKMKGHVFAGWAKKRSAAASIPDRKPIAALTKNGGTTTLYATWRPCRYSVRFLANGGTGTMKDAAFVWGKKRKLPACRFSRDGYVFIGWAETAKGKVRHGNAEKVLNLTAKDGKTLKFHARWAKARYVVRFDANGGKGTMKDESFDWGTAKKLRRNAFSRKGHRFIGWAKSADATRPDFRDAEKVLNLTAKGGAVLYAVWIEKNDPSVVLCLGDSITEGFRCHGDPYPTRLARMTGWSVRNWGKGGELSSYGAEIAEEAVWTERPSRVCILFGANDAIGSRDPSWTKENLRTIIRICKENGCTPAVATPTPQTGSHERFNDNVARIASAVRALAREEGVALVDLYSAFDGGYLNPDDGLHLNNAGGDLMARMFRDAFR